MSYLVFAGLYLIVGFIREREELERTSRRYGLDFGFEVFILIIWPVFALLEFLEDEDE